MSIMKILMIHQHYFPEMSGTARRTKELAESFVKKNHEVTVLTSFPRDFRSMPGEVFENNEIINGVRVKRVKTIFQVKRNVALRMFSYLFFVLQSLFFSIKLAKKSNLIITIAPISSGIIGSICKKFTNTHHHFDVPDILPDLGISAGMIKNKILIKFLYKLEKWVYSNCDTISAITKGQIKNIKNKGVSASKLYYIPDWIDDKFFITNQKKNNKKISRLFKNFKTYTISFVGNIGALQNPVIFLDVMESFQKDKIDNIDFLFIGDGIMLPSLKKIANDRKIKNIKFLGRVNRSEVPSYMKNSSILLANYVPNDYMKICIPGKIFEYAISEIPIIMGAEGEARKLVEKYELGIAVEPSNVNSFKKAIKKIVNKEFNFSPDITNFVKDFSLNNVSELYDEIFKLVHE